MGKIRSLPLMDIYFCSFHGTENISDNGNWLKLIKLLKIISFHDVGWTQEISFWSQNALLLMCMSKIVIKPEDYLLGADQVKPIYCYNVKFLYIPFIVSHSSFHSMASQSNNKQQICGLSSRYIYIFVKNNIYYYSIYTFFWSHKYIIYIYILLMYWCKKVWLSYHLFKVVSTCYLKVWVVELLLISYL